MSRQNDGTWITKYNDIEMRVWNHGTKFWWQEGLDGEFYSNGGPARREAPARISATGYKVWSGTIQKPIGR